MSSLISGTLNGLVTMRDIAECLATIKSLHPGWNDPDSKLTTKLWYYNLQHFTTEEVKRAVLNVASKSKYTPKLSDVLEAIEHQKITQEHLLGIETVDQEREFLKRADQWFHDLSEHELNAMTEKVEHYITTGEGTLNEYELDRATTIQNIRKLFEKGKES